MQLKQKVLSLIYPTGGFVMGIFFILIVSFIGVIIQIGIIIWWVIWTVRLRLKGIKISQLDTKKDSLKCPHCQNTFNIRYFHAGFSDIEFLYCNKCPNAVQISAYDDLHSYFYGKYMGLSFVVSGIISMVSGGEVAFGNCFKFQKETEMALKPCPCGGNFSYKAKPRCPCCLNSISRKDIKKQWVGYRRVYAIVIGELFGEKDIWGDISYLKDELSEWAERYDEKKFSPIEIPLKEKVDKKPKFTWREFSEKFIYIFFQHRKLERARSAYEILQKMKEEGNQNIGGG